MVRFKMMSWTLCVMSREHDRMLNRRGGMGLEQELVGGIGGGRDRKRESTFQKGQHSSSRQRSGSLQKIQDMMLSRHRRVLCSRSWSDVGQDFSVNHKKVELRECPLISKMLE